MSCHINQIDPAVSDPISVNNIFFLACVQHLNRWAYQLHFSASYLFEGNTFGQCNRESEVATQHFVLDLWRQHSNRGLLISCSIGPLGFSAGTGVPDVTECL